MWIKSFYIKNFRNIREQTFIFNKNMNIFYGNNAQGKTNLMEAISICLGRNFRKARTAAIVPFEMEQDGFVELKMVFVSDLHPSKENKIEFLYRESSLKITYNGINMKSAFELYGVLKYTVFIPEHLELIKGTPDQRRDFLDNIATLQNKTHSIKLREYNKAMKQKNALLPFYEPKHSNSEEYFQLLSWNEILAAEGLNITYGRVRYFPELKEVASKLYFILTGEKERLSMRYFCNVFDCEETELDFSKENRAEILAKYISAINSTLCQDKKTNSTSKGVHKDDIYFEINGHSVRNYGSQGQVRSVALVLKLAEAELIRRRNNETPVIILDDVLSELDELRRKFVISQIADTQVFITSCNRKDFQDISTAFIWEVNNGEFYKL